MQKACEFISMHGNNRTLYCHCTSVSCSNTRQWQPFSYDEFLCAQIRSAATLLVRANDALDRQRPKEADWGIV